MKTSSDAQVPLVDTADTQYPAHVHTPAPLSPPGTKTPPTAMSKRPLSNGSAPNSKTRERSVSEQVDANALSKALHHIEEAGRQRENTPGASPSRKRQRIYGDRFIPSRGQDFQASYSLLHEDGSPATPSRSAKKTAQSELHFQKKEANRTYSSLLRSEMFDNEVPQSIPPPAEHPSRSRTPPVSSSALPATLTPSTPHKNLFNYAFPASLTPRSLSRGPNMNARSDIYSLSPVKYSSRTMLLSPRKTPRQVSKVPYKVLDAPELADDFYLNLVDWGSSGVLAVGLGQSVYLWDSTSGVVRQLVQLEGESVTSVGWIQRGSHLAIGTSRGLLLIYDTVHSRRLRTMSGHTARLSSLSWNAHILSSGSRDRSILHRDVRSPAQYIQKLSGHKQEVCGLRWNTDTGQLASGGNDNKIFVWEGLGERWLHRWGETEGGHRAAVKAVAWSPHQRGLLATGGGTADRCIKFWNTISTSQTAASPSATFSTRIGLDLLDRSDRPHSNGNNDSPTPPSLLTQSEQSNPHLLRSLDTGSQVCNLLFSLNTSELVSTHGYSQHAINVWKYPSMQQVVSLTGHTYRVLYLAMKPDGTTIVTGAGDETLRFWEVFKRGKDEQTTKSTSVVADWGSIR
ncbi:substrate-specific activator of APC-dependent proteolysis [Elasticomyces elasticus]|nr:substrate-specific activator of APC-dependent proteolysis [Elasticomyces elasticus]